MYMPEVIYAPNFSHYGLLYLGIEMSENITLNRLIVPCGQLHALPHDRAIQSVTV
jgi:hypothetical protein